MCAVWMFMYVYVCKWKREGILVCLFANYVFWDQVSSVPAVHQIAWQAGQHDPPVSAPCPDSKHWGYRHVPSMLGFFLRVGAGKLNSGPHAYTVGTSPTEPSCQLFLGFESEDINI